MNYKTVIAVVLCIAALGAIFAGCSSAPQSADNSQTNAAAPSATGSSAQTSTTGSNDLALVSQNDTDIGEII